MTQAAFQELIQNQLMTQANSQGIDLNLLEQAGSRNNSKRAPLEGPLVAPVRRGPLARRTGFEKSYATSMVQVQCCHTSPYR